MIEAGKERIRKRSIDDDGSVKKEHSLQNISIVVKESVIQQHASTITNGRVKVRAEILCNSVHGLPLPLVSLNSVTALESEEAA